MRNSNPGMCAAALTQVQDPITKVTHVMRDEDGTEFRIVGELCIGFNEANVDYYIHRRANAEQRWELLSKDPHPDWRTMSVDDYVKHGRSPLLQALSFPKLFKLMAALKLLGMPKNTLDVPENVTVAC